MAPIEFATQSGNSIEIPNPLVHILLGTLAGRRDDPSAGGKHDDTDLTEGSSEAVAVAG
jgi:hypothetical protein